MEYFKKQIILRASRLRMSAEPETQKLEIHLLHNDQDGGKAPILYYIIVPHWNRRSQVEFLLLHRQKRLLKHWIKVSTTETDCRPAAFVNHAKNKVSPRELKVRDSLWMASLNVETVRTNLFWSVLKAPPESIA